MAPHTVPHTQPKSQRGRENDDLSCVKCASDFVLAKHFTVQAVLLASLVGLLYLWWLWRVCVGCQMCAAWWDVWVSHTNLALVAIYIKSVARNIYRPTAKRVLYSVFMIFNMRCTFRLHDICVLKNSKKLLQAYIYTHTHICLLSTSGTQIEMLFVFKLRYSFLYVHNVVILN